MDQSHDNSRYHACLKRLHNERLMFPHLTISPLTLQPNQRLQWMLCVPGPPHSPYTGHVYELEIEYESTYPFTAPYLRFRTPIFHPNITPSGMMSNLMIDTWSPRDTVETIYERAQQLLAAPLKEYPYNDAAADLYKEDITAFWQSVQDTYKTKIL
jgi:ubiquitin-conjugating enzyme E2 C